MNRTLALLIPAVLLVGMALIIFQQMNGSENLDPVSVSSLSSQTNASNDLLPMGPENSQIGSQTGIVSPPAGLGPNATTSASGTPQSGALSGTNEPGSNTARSELGRLADAQGAQGNQGSQGSAATTPATPQSTAQTTGQNMAQGDSKPAGTTSPSAATTSPAESKPAEKPADTKPADSTPQLDLPKHAMQSMSFKYQGSEILFVMKANEHFEYKTFLLPSPDRLVIDLAGAWTGLEAVNVPSNRLVKGLRLGKLEKGHRVVLDLKEVPKGYETSRDGNTVTVRIY